MLDADIAEFLRRLDAARNAVRTHEKHRYRVGPPLAETQVEVAHGDVVLGIVTTTTATSSG